MRAAARESLSVTRQKSGKTTNHKLITDSNPERVPSWARRTFWDLSGVGRSGAWAPRFALEPPALVEYSNSSGAVLACRPQLVAGQLEQQQLPAARRSGLALATPTYVSWRLVRRLAGEQEGPQEEEELEEELESQMRQDGALVLAPFAPADFRRDIHAATYRCCLSNQFGRLCSRPVRARAGKSSPSHPIGLCATQLGKLARLPRTRPAVARLPGPSKRKYVNQLGVAVCLSRLDYSGRLKRATWHPRLEACKQAGPFITLLVIIIIIASSAKLAHDLASGRPETTRGASGGALRWSPAGGGGSAIETRIIDRLFPVRLSVAQKSTYLAASSNEPKLSDGSISELEAGRAANFRAPTVSAGRPGGAAAAPEAAPAARCESIRPSRLPYLWAVVSGFGRRRDTREDGAPYLGPVGRKSRNFSQKALAIGSLKLRSIAGLRPARAPPSKPI